jgi:hypothetical protein
MQYVSMGQITYVVKVGTVLLWTVHGTSNIKMQDVLAQVNCSYCKTQYSMYCKFTAGTNVGSGFNVDWLWPSADAHPVPTYPTGSACRYGLSLVVIAIWR